MIGEDHVFKGTVATGNQFIANSVVAKDIPPYSVAVGNPVVIAK